MRIQFRNQFQFRNPLPPSCAFPVAPIYVNFMVRIIAAISMLTAFLLSSLQALRARVSSTNNIAIVGVKLWCADPGMLLSTSRVTPWRISANLLPLNDVLCGCGARRRRAYRRLRGTRARPRRGFSTAGPSQPCWRHGAPPANAAYYLHCFLCLLRRAPYQSCDNTTYNIHYAAFNGAGTWLAGQAGGGPLCPRYTTTGGRLPAYGRRQHVGWWMVNSSMAARRLWHENGRRAAIACCA